MTIYIVFVDYYNYEQEFIPCKTLEIARRVVVEYAKELGIAQALIEKFIENQTQIMLLGETNTISINAQTLIEV